MALLKLAKYGKDKVRVFRMVRNADGTHDVAEWIVCALVEGEIEKAWTESDNSNIVATDSIKNMVYLFSKQSPHCLSPEKFALDLALHLVSHYAHLHKSHVDITQLKWSRIPVAGKPHKHSFVRNGDEKRLTSVSVDGTAGKDKMTATVTSGIKDLLVLKTTESSFENYVFDKFTTLKPVDDRIFSTAVDCSYTIPISSSSLTRSAIANLGIDFEAIYRSVEKTTLEIFATHNSASVQATLYQMCEKILKDNKHVGEVTYKLPNKHYFAVDMAYYGLKNTAPKDAEVFMPVDAPSGLIIATVARDASAKL
ncbi:hypothetical protein BCR35DRAFT_302595 [Leucosporidium creatinivorum]|uniref:Uricase n=1 Tax=Leucosporidium creatinivorum TaxID=106004 RepID=A0A1Y2FS21_9BASI|nr:hypothetical protein BCR35DRAFT_302595 [Leucosporidium creatinivorum]